MAEGAQGSPLTEAYQAFEANKFEEAEASFREHLKQHPQDWQQLYNTGVSLYQQKKFEEARSLFEQARQSPDPGLKSRAAYNQGMAELMLQRLDQSEQSFQDALSYDNDNKTISENLAWVREQKAKQQEAQNQKPNQGQSQNQAQNQDQKQNQDQSQNQNQKQPDNQSPSPENKPQDQKQAEEKAGQDGQKNDSGQGSPSPPKAGESGQGEPKQAQNKDPSGADQTPTDPQKPLSQSSEKSAAAQNQKPGSQEQDPGQKAAAAGAPGGAEKPEAGREQAQAENQSPAPEAAANEGLEEMPELAQEAKNAAGGRPGEGSSKGRAKILSAKELERQEAEKILRTIEDKIGRYPLTEGGAQGKKGANDDSKAW